MKVASWPKYVLFALLFAAASAVAQQRTAGETIDDSTLVPAVKLALLDDASIPGGKINVEAYKGTVQLIGYTRNKVQKERAVDIARGVNNVEKVLDAMLIVPKARSFGRVIDDQALQAQVVLKIADIGADEVLSVVTDVRNGEVLLGGFVDSRGTRDQIAKAAAAVDGVTKVHNRLAIRD